MYIVRNTARNRLTVTVGLCVEKRSDAERAAGSKRLAGEKRAAAAAEKRAAKAEAQAAGTGKEKAAGAVVVKTPGKGRKSLAKAPEVVPTKPPKVVKPAAKGGVFQEATRSSYLCRTGGVGPIGSKAFSYKGGIDEATAKRNATEWLKTYLASHA